MDTEARAGDGLERPIARHRLSASQPVSVQVSPHGSGSSDATTSVSVVVARRSGSLVVAPERGQMAVCCDQAMRDATA